MVTVPRAPLPDRSGGSLWRAALDRWLPARAEPTNRNSEHEHQGERNPLPRSYKTVFDGTREALRTEPGQAPAAFTAESRQAEGLRSEVQTRQVSLTFAGADRERPRAAE